MSLTLKALPPKTKVNAVTAAGAAQGSAAALRVGFLNYVTAADGAKGVILPTAAIGNRLTVYNSSASVLLVYPFTSDTINEGSANAAISMAAYSWATFECLTVVNWACQYSGSPLTGGTITTPTIISPTMRGAGIVQNFRRRCTIAEVNAGVSLLAAVTGYKYRLIDGSMIAIGGAAAAHTTIDIIGTQSASAVKLVAFAVANTAQNTLLKPGVTGAAILAGGLSFVQNDVTTAITAGVTGSPITTATHIDINVTYELAP